MKKTTRLLTLATMLLFTFYSCDIIDIVGLEGRHLDRGIPSDICNTKDIRKDGWSEIGLTRDVVLEELVEQLKLEFKLDLPMNVETYTYDVEGIHRKVFSCDNAIFFSAAHRYAISMHNGGRSALALEILVQLLHLDNAHNHLYVEVLEDSEEDDHYLVQLELKAIGMMANSNSFKLDRGVSILNRIDKFPKSLNTR